MRGFVICADITLDGDREFHGYPVIFFQCRAISLHQRRQFAEPTGIDNKPGVANPRCAPHRYIGLPGDIERRPAQSHWLYADASITDCVEPALVAYPLLGP